MLALAAASCASNSQESGFNAFLQTIAAECKPLIIGSDNIGQAIVFNGLGAQPENYNNFLGQTKALYNGSIPATVYRSTLNSFLGGGSSNDRSFDCIVAHLPKA
jgi:pilus assembly protein TadC